MARKTWVVLMLAVILAFVLALPGCGQPSPSIQATASGQVEGVDIPAPYLNWKNIEDR